MDAGQADVDVFGLILRFELLLLPSEVPLIEELAISRRMASRSEFADTSTGDKLGGGLTKAAIIEKNSMT